MQLQTQLPPSWLDIIGWCLHPAAPTASTNGEQNGFGKTVSPNQTLMKRYEAALLMNRIGD